MSPGPPRRGRRAPDHPPARAARSLASVCM